jgi:NadR type nicotinamide-nucleotide adenylyltransferase
MPLKRIVVIGPESTGKSTLCEQLAAHYHTGWVPEFAREYLTTHGTAYRYEDLLTIAKGQVEQEDRMAMGARDLLFVDTDLYVMKVWSEFVFGQCDPWILKQITVRQYDGYLLCRTDLPWAAEELREYPDLATREKLFHIYKDILVNQTTPWSEVGGLAGQRLEGAIAAVNKLIA